MIATTSRGGFAIWRHLMATQLRESPLRMLLTMFAIALGVALGASVFLVNAAALYEFGLATQRLVGEADVVVRGPRDGFAESEYAQLARDPSIGVASPVLELEVALPGRREALKVLGMDSFLATTLQPALIGDIGANVLQMFQTGGIFLSSAAAEQLHLRHGDTLAVTVGSAVKSLTVLGLLAPGTYSQALGIMDIASAQWVFDRVGTLNRIDLRLNKGVNVDTYRRDLQARLPVGLLAVAPDVERNRAATVTRAYRVNLNMLALVSLWTGAFLVFSTQSLAVLRRRRSLALLRALGVTRAQLQWALVGEGVAVGAAGSLVGVVLAVLIAAALLQALAGDLGNGQLHAAGASLQTAPLAMLGFFIMGIGVAAIGAWMPARNAARLPPAQSLKGGSDDHAVLATTSARVGIALLLAGAGLTRLPPVFGLPVFGYVAIALLLFGTVLLVPALTIRILRVAPLTGRVVLDTAIAQLKDSVGVSTLSLASVIVSFSLMVAMAVMVYSFRASFEHWLGRLLPAEIELREPLGSDTAFLSPDMQTRLAALDGVDRIEFRRARQILLDAEHPPVTLIARNASDQEAADALPLVRKMTQTLPPTADPVWISEPLQDLYDYQLGDRILLPLGAQRRPFIVAGIWRDYARSSGAAVVSRRTYVEATGDRSANEGSIWLNGRRSAAATEAELRAVLTPGGSLDIMTTSALRQRSLQIFDRAFAITYALEVIAVLIGLTGVSFAASSTALARRAEFGMLRHIGMLRRQVIGMLACEGCLLSLFGAVYGLLLGGGLSLVLVYVVNRQSFNWSIDLAVPAWQLAALSVTLVIAATVAALWSGRGATSKEAVSAVREDW